MNIQEKLVEEIFTFLPRIANYAKNVDEWKKIKEEIIYFLDSTQKKNASRYFSPYNENLNDFDKTIIEKYEQISGLKLKIKKDIKKGIRRNEKDLTDEEVYEIKELIWKEETNRARVAFDYKISPKVIDRIDKKEIFTHVKDPDFPKVILKKKGREICKKVKKRGRPKKGSCSKETKELISKKKKEFYKKNEDPRKTKLTKKDVAKIKRRLLNGELVNDFVDEYPVSKRQLEHIRDGRRWVRVEPAKK